MKVLIAALSLILLTGCVAAPIAPSQAPGVDYGVSVYSGPAYGYYGSGYYYYPPVYGPYYAYPPAYGYYGYYGPRRYGPYGHRGYRHGGYRGYHRR